MKNGNVREFIDHIHYGDEFWFLYNGTKYFLEGWIENDILELVLYEMSDAHSFFEKNLTFFEKKTIF